MVPDVLVLGLYQDWEKPDLECSNASWNVVIIIAALSLLRPAVKEAWVQAVSNKIPNKQSVFIIVSLMELIRTGMKHYIGPAFLVLMHCSCCFLFQL